MELLSELRQRVRTIYYEKYLIPKAYSHTKDLKIMNSYESIQYIIDNKCSVSRFGDGEFDQIFERGGDYQRPSERLAGMLKECLTSNLPKHKVAIDLNLKTYQPHLNFWSGYVVSHYKMLLPYLSFNKIYLDTQLSRFYLYKCRTDEQCRDHINLLKQIWDNRDMVIVEGCQTCSGIGNDLYDNAKSIQRIIGPAQSGFDRYDDIYNYIVANVSKDRLIMLSFGIAATVLSYELAKIGYQAIDIGHLDIEYEWFRLGVKDRVAIKGKFTNEVADGHNPDVCIDPIYKSQILADFSKIEHAQK